ncbi:TlpA family protein disulfide reductase, partial [Parafilimonas sp.]|uniref:TlpA family protein disulfide reductase n=1 Tax=Parafilimonas sp. TaxID=1969739 RepID=UPI0039E537C9
TTNNRYNPKKISLDYNNSAIVSNDYKQAAIIIFNFSSKLISVLTQPDDNIKINVFFSDDNNKKIDSIQFSGNNAQAHSLYNNLMRLVIQQNFILEQVFLQNELHSDKDLFNRSNFVIDSLISEFETLKNKKLADSTFCAIALVDIKATFLSTLFLCFDNFLYYQQHKAFPKNAIAAAVIKSNEKLLNKPSYNALRKAYYCIFNPLDTTLKYATFGLEYCDYYAGDLYENIVVPQTAYDQRFYALSKGEKKLGYLKGVLLEALWKDILYANSYVSENIDSVYLGFSLFKKLFPHSPYLPLLSERFKNYPHKPANTTAQAVQIDFLKTEQYSTLDQLLSQFKGEWVFIDVWATWCVPCLQEFGFEDNLLPLLDKRKIKPVLISIDNDLQNERWKELVRKKKLKGVHIRASEKLYADLQNKLYEKKGVVAIPKYVLVNPAGKIVDKDLPRPSDISNLERKLNELISD